MRFDTLLRQVARQTTRRAALATVLGGALLLHAPAASEATKEAKRRKDHRRRAMKRLRPISFRVDNTDGTSAITLNVTAVVHNHSCRFHSQAVVPPGGVVPFDTSQPTAFVTFSVAGQKYWFTFDNNTLARPDLSVALNGSTRNVRPGERCPYRHGIQYLNDKPMDFGSTIEITVEGHYFRVRRLPDTNYINFTLVLSNTL